MENNPRLAGAGAGTRHPVAAVRAGAGAVAAKYKIVRPGLDRLTRAIAAARAAAVEEILHYRLAPQLQAQRCQRLDALLVPDPTLRVAALVWLFAGATSESPESIKGELAKLAYLRELGADRLDLNAVPPERRRQLATVARRSTPAALHDMDPARRHPMLLAALAVAHTEIIDEVVQMFDQALAGTDHRARHVVAERQRDLVAANLGRLGLLDEILDVVLDPGLDEEAVGAAVRGWDMTGSPPLCGNPMSGHPATVGTWSWWRPATRTCGPSPRRCWARCRSRPA